MIKNNRIIRSCRIICFVLLCCVLAIGNSLLAFGSADSNIDALSEKEKMLFDAIVDMSTDDFFNPSAVRLLEVGDYSGFEFSNETEELSQLFEELGMAEQLNDALMQPDLVIVRLQGENKAGGTLNHYYKVCIKGYEKTGELNQEMIDALEKQIEISESLVAINDFLDESTSDDYEKLMETKSELMEYKADVGDYVDLGDDYEVKEDASDTFDIGKINKALKEYWENLGF